ncbi:DNA cytosine methyltransferase [Phenylobacterium sp.]|jgi:DNA (cytosine-5)-methyltransferase 1|uniref:DNA cytosine methyltransferase n=1 Tax=Phenylobacterium sp. TaxID=1871053 RepID=UPI002F413529
MRGAHPTDELIIDLFAGGGGASTAILNATGRHPDVAVNHDLDAIGMHEANHPATRHFHCDVREVDPVVACTVDGVLQPVGLMWASPDCTHFSKARGGMPVEKGIRSLADVVVDWARAVRPRLIHLENVEEFQDWGPVLENGQPCPERKGLDFRRWVKALEDLGYVVDWRELVAADYGAPTTRKRLFLIARCDGEPIRWPAPTHASRAKLAKGELFGSALKPWRSAAEIIDWSLPIPSIWDRKKPLADKTLARIAKGVRRFVIESPKPFIVPLTHSGPGRVHDLADPLRTVTGANGGEFSLIEPTLAVAGASVGVGGRAGQSPPRGLDDPLHTVMAKGDRAIASAMLVPRYGEREGQAPRSLDIGAPYPTVVPTGNGGDLSVAYLSRQFGSTVSGRDLDEPAPTVMGGRAAGGKSGVVAAHLSRMAKGSVGGDLADPAKTLLAHSKDAIVAAHLSSIAYGDDRPRAGLRASSPEESVGTVTGSNDKTVVAACLEKYYGTGAAGADAEQPLPTITDRMRFGLAGVFMEQANTGMVGHPMERPLSTIVAGGGEHVGWGTTQRLIEVRLAEIESEAGPRRRKVLEFLWAHFGPPSEDEWADPIATAMGRLRLGLVRIAGAVWQIVDIGMRMLVPRELFNAQGFPPGYIIDRTADGRPITKTSQTAKAGNSVSPPMAEATLRENLTWMTLPDRRAA